MNTRTGLVSRTLPVHLMIGLIHVREIQHLRIKVNVRIQITDIGNQDKLQKECTEKESKNEFMTNSNIYQLKQLKKEANIITILLKI